MTGDLVVKVVDEENATGVSRGFGIFQLEDGSYAFAMARLGDRYTRKDGHWKIAHRKVGILSQFKVVPDTALVLCGRSPSTE